MTKSNGQDWEYREGITACLLEGGFKEDSFDEEMQTS